MIKKKQNKSVGDMKVWASMKQGKKEESKEERESMEFDETPAIVKLTLGRTLNTGNYESIRVDVGVELPCPVRHIGKAQKKARELVESALEEIIDELVEGK